MHIQPPLQQQPPMQEYHPSYNPIEPKKPRRWPWVLLVLVLLFVGGAMYAWNLFKNMPLEDLLQSEFVQNQVSKHLDPDEANILFAVPIFLGFTEPQTYLVLFLNNTELRPGGGFIGSYALINVDRGDVEIAKVEGTEILDRKTPDDWRPEPPAILIKHLKVDRWYFRDSNWSPDFAVSAEKSLELYAGEGGMNAPDIDMVVGITTTVLEELMKLTGPITIQDIEFTSDNVIEKLEYEVEYGYDDKGIHFLERKQIMEPLMREMLNRLKGDAFDRAGEFDNVLKQLAQEKQIMVYTNNETVKPIIAQYDMFGTMSTSTGDYLMWVDANLAALKTDHAIERTLAYTMTKRPAAHEGEQDYYLASARMTYTHIGVFDWRTTRYRTYARVYVPLGAELVSTNGAMAWDRSTEPGVIDSGVENGRQWFGAFIAIEPGKTGTLEFVYRVPSSVVDMIKNGDYTLEVQKQLGSVGTDLTLDLNFDTTITAAKPGERKEEWGDSTYTYETDLSGDREFVVSF